MLMEWYDNFGENDNSENLEEVSSRWENFPQKIMHVYLVLQTWVDSNILELKYANCYFKIKK